MRNSIQNSDLAPHELSLEINTFHIEADEEITFMATYKHK